MNSGTRWLWLNYFFIAERKREVQSVLLQMIFRGMGWMLKLWWVNYFLWCWMGLDSCSWQNLPQRVDILLFLPVIGAWLMKLQGAGQRQWFSFLASAVFKQAVGEQSKSLPSTGGDKGWSIKGHRAWGRSEREPGSEALSLIQCVKAPGFGLSFSEPQL